MKCVFMKMTTHRRININGMNLQLVLLESAPCSAELITPVGLKSYTKL